MSSAIGLSSPTRNQASIPLEQSAYSGVQDFSKFDSAELSGHVEAVGSSSFRASVKLSIVKNGAGTYEVAASDIAGDDVSGAPLVSFQMTGSLLEAKIDAGVASFSSAVIKFALISPPNSAGSLDIAAENIVSGTVDSARIPGLDAGKIVSGSIDEARLPDSVNGSRQAAASGTVSNTSSTSASNFARITIPKTDYGESGGMFIISLATADQHYSAMGIFNRRSSSSSIVARIQTATGSGTFMGSVTLTISGNELRFNYVGSASNSGGPRGTILVQSIDPNVSVAF